MIEVDPIVIGYAGALALFVLLALGIPVGVSMGVIGVAGMLLGVGEALTFGQLRTLPVRSRQQLRVRGAADVRADGSARGGGGTHLAGLPRRGPVAAPVPRRGSTRR